MDILTFINEEVTADKILGAKSLHAIKCTLNLDCVVAIANMPLEELKIYGTHLDDKCLAEILKCCFNKLSFLFCEINDHKCELIAKGLETSDSLQILKLCSNKIKYEGSVSIARMLTINTKLCVLDLSNNSVGGEGASEIANALISNTSVSVLDLSDNNIGDTGAISIANMLVVNRSLQLLYLGDNNILDEGGIAIARALTNNTSLIALSLLWNEIRSETDLATYLNRNYTLTEVMLDYFSDGMDTITNRNQQILDNRRFISTKIATDCTL